MLSILFAAAMLPSLNFHPDGAEEYSLHGTAQGPDGRALPATIWISCRGAGSVGVELDFSAPDSGFDLADFVGPRDAAQDLPPSRLSWTTPARVSSIALSAAGWHPHDSPSYLQFNIQEAKTPPGPLLALLLLIERGGRLEWTQPAFDDPHRAISATFAVNGADDKNVQWQVGRCFDPSYPGSRQANDRQ